MKSKKNNETLANKKYRYCYERKPVLLINFKGESKGNATLPTTKRKIYRKQNLQFQ